jgi:hypothetical protein
VLRAPMVLADMKLAVESSYKASGDFMYKLARVHYQLRGWDQAAA